MSNANAADIASANAANTNERADAIRPSILCIMSFSSYLVLVGELEQQIRTERHKKLGPNFGKMGTMEWCPVQNLQAFVFRLLSSVLDGREKDKRRKAEDKGGRSLDRFCNSAVASG